MKALSLYELDFTDEDLAANRSGELTEHQRARLTQWDKTTRQMIGYGIMVFALISAAMIGFEFIRTGGTLELFAQRQTPFVLIILGVFLAAMMLITVLVQINSRAVKRGKISTVEGKARVDTYDVNMRGTPPYRLTTVRIEKTQFRFLHPLSAAVFTDGKRFRVYLLRVPLFARPIPLSVERI